MTESPHEVWPPAASGRWPIEGLRGALRPLLPEIVVQCVGRIDSSNAELMRRARSGDPRPTLLVAETQTAGRGRQGRRWHDNGPLDGQDLPATLMFSLSRPIEPVDWSGLSLAVGVALAEALHPGIRLKWPNDLWWEERKLAGILVETAHVHGRRHVVVGVGINIREPLGGDFSTPPAWVDECLPGADAAGVLMRVAAPMAGALAMFEARGFAAFAAGFAARDGLRGRAIVLSDGASGTAAGVDDVGGLLVHTSSGMKTVISQEVSVRPGASGAATDRG